MDAPQTIIVVLGQSLNPDGSAPPTLIARARCAAELAQAEGCPVVCTGGDPSRAGRSEAEVLRGLLVETPAVHVETASCNTCQNASNCIPLIEQLAGSGSRVLLGPRDCRPCLKITYESSYDIRDNRKEGKKNTKEQLKFRTKRNTESKST